MPTTHFCLDAHLVTRTLIDWHHTARVGDVAVITVPFQVRTIRLVCRPDNLLRWWPAGERGATVTLQDALQRLQMLYEVRKVQIPVREVYRVFVAGSSRG